MIGRVLLLVVGILTFVQITTASGQAYCLDSYAYMPRDVFLTWTCSNCFAILFRNKPITTERHPKYSLNLLLKTNTSVQYAPNATNPPDAEVCDKYLSPGECAQWYECCAAAKQCCEGTLQEPIPKQENVSYCPAIWDGVECWSAVEENSMVHQECPTYFVLDYLRSSDPKSTKMCMENGTWYRRLNTDRSWTNYSDCSDQNIQDILRNSIFVSFACHVISLASLVIAVALYAAFRAYLRRDEKGRCKFNLNLNLFIAFILMGLFTIVWEPIFVLGYLNDVGGGAVEDSIECKVLKIFIWYFRSATYWWLFCEGWYLHEVLSNPLARSRSMIKYLIIGWGIPLPPIIAWAVLRANESCWGDDTSQDHLQFIVIVPNLVALLLNFILLITVQAKVMGHFADANDDDTVELVRQGIKVTISLIPVFGVQTILLSYRPENWFEYDFIEKIVVGLQGFVVALMYCFITKEIRIAFQRFKRNRSVTMSKSSSRATQSSRLSTSVTGSTSGRNDSLPMQELGGVKQNGTRNSAVGKKLQT